MEDLPHGGHAADRRLPDQEHHGSSFLGPLLDLLKVENQGGVAAEDGEGSQAAVESMVRVAKLAACLAGCAAMTWPSYTAKAAVAAALAIGLAYEVSRGFSSGFWTRSQDPGIQQVRFTEHSIRLQPRLCALRPSPAREEKARGVRTTNQSRKHKKRSRGQKLIGVGPHATSRGTCLGN